jgi:hypothetical protein
VANRINGTESLTRKGFNCLLQQNLPEADIGLNYSAAVAATVSMTAIFGSRFDGD